MDLTTKDNLLEDISKIISMDQPEASKSKIQFIKLRNHTTDYLISIGVNDLPMLERTGHIRDNILSIEDAIKKGFNDKNKHYHGIGVKKYIEIVNSLNKPIAIYKYNKKNKFQRQEFIIVSKVSKHGMYAVIPIEINCTYYNENIKFNRIKSIYFANLKRYITYKIEKGLITKIYDIKRDNHITQC